MRAGPLYHTRALPVIRVQCRVLRAQPATGCCSAELWPCLRVMLRGTQTGSCVCTSTGRTQRGSDANTYRCLYACACGRTVGQALQEAQSSGMAAAERASPGGTSMLYACAAGALKGFLWDYIKAMGCKVMDQENITIMTLYLASLTELHV